MQEIEIKTSEEIEKMREGGKIAARILKMLGEAAKPGVKTSELDMLARDQIAKAGAKPSFLGHGGFQAAICASINEEIVHGIPSDKILKEGDIVGIDLGVYFKGYHNDTAITVGVGKIDVKAKSLLKITQNSLKEGIKLIKPGIHLGNVQHRVQTIIEEAGYGVIRDLTGHGIGKELQQHPPIPNYGADGTGPVLKEGMVLAIEPMVSMGDWHVKTLHDGWTVVLADGSLGAHFEHTVAITKDGSEVLTK